jgi:DNA-binding winged helix-turn-helix (wHTH) protein
MSADFPPISVDLARESDFSLGPLRVRPSLRQVESGAGAETLEPRIMQVLVALSRKRGEVVSRDELIQVCWGGRAVGDDALNRCISRIRKLGETDAAFTLETIPRVGYRLMAPDSAAVDGPAPPPAPGSEAAPAPAPSFDLRGLLAKPATWAGAGFLIIVIVTLAFLLRPSAPAGGQASVDAVVAQLTEKLQQQTAAPTDIQRAGAAAQALGGSGQAEERSAFAALASGDTAQALTVLEDYAAGLEAQGKRAEAADVYTRIGSLALLVDQGRGLAARRKAFQLAPDSLAGFQGLFFDISLLKGSEAGIAFANEVLSDPALSPRMRGWVLSHRATQETDGLREYDVASATVAEIERLAAQTNDPLIIASATWPKSLIALNQSDLHAALAISAQGLELWNRLPERLPGGPEVSQVRALYAAGDLPGSLERGLELLDRRGRNGEFLPTPIIQIVCEAGVFSGRVGEAEPSCRSLARRSDSTFGASARTYSGLIAAGLGDDRLATAEFAAAEATGSLRPGTQMQLLYFRAFAAMKAGRSEEAERLTAYIVTGIEASPTPPTWRVFRAAALLRLGEGLVGAGKGSRACRPLSEASRIYADVGGDAGRNASDTLRRTAGCR